MEILQSIFCISLTSKIRFFGNGNYIINNVNGRFSSLEDQIRKHSVLLNDCSSDSDCGSIQVGISTSDKINATDFSNLSPTSCQRKTLDKNCINLKSSEKIAKSKFWQKLPLTLVLTIQLALIFFFTTKKKT